MADNVWGTGGLFEKALASKLDRQGAETALANSNVGVNMLEAQNKYDLGLRQLPIEQQKADTLGFNADTARGELAGRMQNPFTTNDLRNNGLLGRSFGIGSSLGSGMGSMALDTTRKLGEPQKPMGFKNGGKVKTMKAMAGYNKGGKVKMVGCEDGGKIGDVANDTGKDTVPVKARPGEYFLNPETVSHVGDGNYEHGVRRLDALVRDATGKEPGPTPLPKGEKGFALSGVNADDPTGRAAASMRRFRAAGMVPDAAGGPTMFVDSAGTTSADPNAGFYRQAAAAKQAEAAAAAAASQPSMAQRAANAVGASSVSAGSGQLANAGAAETLAGTLRNSKLGRAAGVLGAAQGANDVYEGLRTGDYGRAGWGALDTAASAAPFVPALAAGVPAALVYGAGRAGAGVGNMVYNNMSEDSKDTVGGTVNNVVRGLGSMFGQDWGVDDSAYLQQKGAARIAAANAKPAASAPQKDEREANNERILANAAAAEEGGKAPTSLRDMLINHYNDLAADTRGQGSISRGETMRNLVNQINESEKTDIQAMTNRINQQRLYREQEESMTKDAKEQSKATFQTDELGKDGKPTGKRVFDEGAYNDFVASVIAPLAQQGLNFYTLPSAKRAQVLADYQDRRRPTDAVMDTLAQHAWDAPRSRGIIGKQQIGAPRELTIGDALNPWSGVGLRDYGRSLVRDGDYDQVIPIKIGGTEYTVPMTAMTRANGRGSSVLKNQVDVDAIRQFAAQQQK